VQFDKPRFEAGPPKRFAQMVVVVIISICILCYYLGQKEAAHWVLSVALILSLMMGFYLYCGSCLMFHIWAMLGMVSENVVRKYKMTFVVKEKENGNTGSRNVTVSDSFDLKIQSQDTSENV